MGKLKTETEKPANGDPGIETAVSPPPEFVGKKQIGVNIKLRYSELVNEQWQPKPDVEFRENHLDLALVKVIRTDEQFRHEDRRIESIDLVIENTEREFEIQQRPISRDLTDEDVVLFRKFFSSVRPKDRYALNVLYTEDLGDGWIPDEENAQQHKYMDLCVNSAMRMAHMMRRDKQWIRRMSIVRQDVSEQGSFGGFNRMRKG